MVRKPAQMMENGTYDGAFQIYGHEKGISMLETFCTMTVPGRLVKRWGKDLYRGSQGGFSRYGAGAGGSGKLFRITKGPDACDVRALPCMNQASAGLALALSSQCFRKKRGSRAAVRTSHSTHMVIQRPFSPILRGKARR